MSLPERIELPLPGGVTLPVRRIVDAGEMAAFRMGSRGMGRIESWFNNEEPIDTVRLNAPFYLGETPVTQRQYRAMAEACRADLEKLEGNRGAEPSSFDGEDRPVEQVDWRDAETVCAWLTNSNDFREAIGKAGLDPTWRVGLPDEARWEYACRAGSETDYWNGDGEAALAEIGWFDRTSEDGTRPTGKSPANRFGLQDLHGNVWEWCADIFDPHAYAKREDGWTDEDAGADASSEFSDDGSSHRVLRGGSWYSSAGYCRSAIRVRFRAGGRRRLIGFRVCLFPGPVAD